ncbi:MAG: Ribose transporter permease component [Aeromicrobium sp.]|jgi:ribose transport system permease protein|nr:Ribose transporter permease component [Aeromicrobium sp.]
MSEVAGAPVTRVRGSRMHARLRGADIALALLGLVGFLGLAATTHGNMLTGNTLRALFQFLAVPILVGLSQMCVLCVGQMNLSVGVLTGFCAMVTATLMVAAGWPAWAAVTAGILVGGAGGLVNGLLVVLTRINGFIVTLATMTILDGLRYRVNGTSTYFGYSPHLVRVGQSTLLGIPTVFLVALVVAAALSGFFRRAVQGRRLLASGGNPLAARLSGISNDRSIVVAHVLSGLLAGIAAVVIVALSGSVNSTIGDDLLLPSFAAPIIAGVALSGGSVSVLGTCLAAFLIRLVDVAQAQYNINASWVDLIVGAVVLGAVLFQQIRRRPSVSV